MFAKCLSLLLSLDCSVASGFDTRDALSRRIIPATLATITAVVKFNDNYAVFVSVSVCFE